MLAVDVGAQFQRREVGAGAGFRITLTPVVFARQNARQIKRALLRRAVADQHRPAHAETHRRDTGRAGEARFGGPDVALHQIPAGAAVLLRPARCDPALRVQNPMPADVGFVVLEHAGTEARAVAQIVVERAVEKPAHVVAEAFVFRQQANIHRLPVL